MECKERGLERWRAQPACIPWKPILPKRRRDEGSGAG